MSGGGWARTVLRFVASVMAVSGVLLLADAGVTLAWQEPVSSLFASRQQPQPVYSAKYRIVVFARLLRSAPVS